MKALSVAVVTLGYSLSVFAQSIPFRCPAPAFSDVVRELDALKLRTPASLSTDVSATLRSAEAFQSTWLLDKKGHIQGVSTIRHGLEDVLVARWAGPPNQPQIRNIGMWDGAMYELVIFELDPGVIASNKSIRDFLRTIIKPPPTKLRMSGPNAQALEDGFGFLRPTTSDTERWQGQILRMPTHQVVGYDEEFFTFHEIEGRVFLVFDFGKRAGWPPQSIYVSDRFPPLSAVIKDWPKQRLLQEVIKPDHQEVCWDSSIAAFSDEFRLRRDEILIAELVRRGLDTDEFREVMDSLNGRCLLIPALDSARQTARYTDPILETIRRYESRPDVNQRIEPRSKGVTVLSYLADLIRVLPTRGGPDFADAMLQLIAADHEAELALNYIYERVSYSGNSADPELADKIAAVKVPAALEQKRNFTVAVIRARLKTP